MIEWCGQNFVSCYNPKLVIIWEEFSISMKVFHLGVYELKDIGSRFRSVLQSILQSCWCDDEKCTCWIPMQFKNSVHDQQYFCFFCDFKTLMFAIFCVFIYFLITTFINFSLSVIAMPSNIYFIYYHFKAILLIYNSNIIGCFINRIKNKLFLESAVRQLMTSICFRIGLDLDGLILVLSFKTFC